MTIKKITRRMQQAVPSGYVLGRVSKGVGPAELIDLRGLTQLGVASAAAAAAGSTSHGFGFSIIGRPTSGEIIGVGVWPGQMTFTSADPGDVVTSQIAATGSAVFQMQAIVSGVFTQVGTITFSAGDTTGAVAWGSGSYQLAANAQLRLVAPAAADATLANISGKVIGVEG